jgi:hypothetical protein
MTSTAAKLVWRMLAEEKGDWRTSRCVPCSMRNTLVGLVGVLQTLTLAVASYRVMSCHGD